MFKRVLIANRGEIALRIIRACQELGIETVCVYSEADRAAPYLRLADRAICIGPPPARESYLNISRIISAAEVADVDAIHPGYGFLSERPDFSEVCRDCKIEFIGPSPEAMKRLGDKVEAKRFAKAAKVPIFPGSEGAIETEDEAVEVANEIGYPVIIKAAAGGGGRGMRVCHNEATLRANIKKAQQEALAAFGNGSVFVEKFLEAARHVEVQVLGDKKGNAVHLFERDCSMQRRHQKVIEEAPGPGIDRKKILAVCESAARLVRSAEYAGAATVEFLMDSKQNFYMLEVNTRVQVEHPVTELITGIDIVKMSILVASGAALPFKQKDISIRGHAIECRINAEDPTKNFMPSAGRIDTWELPGGPGVRIDSHVIPGYYVPPNYDSMIGKLIVHADTREEAIDRAARALREFRVGPIKTTIDLHHRLMQDSAFKTGGIDIHYLERILK
ncbi:MAG: acetyl-CoA carboxylase biotin carboxylase subunit [Phycisphaeraceae bacterium]|nr:acetyl-CoA carboxylase biotin carboxylase subunit [Phycisphaeraceae bacterium]MCW5762565.1 acetyl-CoA carboxylase biotin carboxylase subunit [Phycisphaeraceae bacterium]